MAVWLKNRLARSKRVDQAVKKPPNVVLSMQSDALVDPMLAASNSYPPNRLKRANEHPSRQVICCAAVDYFAVVLGSR